MAAILGVEKIQHTNGTTALTVGTNGSVTVSGDIIKTTAGTSNFAAGVNAGNSIVSGGNFNTVVGDEAGTALTTGDDNTFIGYAAGDATTTATDNVAVGHDAFTANTTGGDTVAIGANALMANTTAAGNTGLGYQALKTNTEGHSNVAVGKNSLKLSTTGDYNVAVGMNALDANTTADNNTAVGYDSLGANTTGAQNTAVGWNSLRATTTGSDNTGLGKRAGDAITTGGNNTAVGTNAGLVITTGSTNTAIGHSSLQSLTTGSGNVAIGQASGGQGSMINIITESNRAVFGHGSITNAYVKVAFTVTSDARDKMNFAEVPHGLSFVNDLQPVKFDFKKSRENATPHGKTKYGFKAQDILALEGNNPIVIDNENEDSLKITDSHLIPILVKALQELSAKNDAIEARLTTLET